MSTAAEQDDGGEIGPVQYAPDPMPLSAPLMWLPSSAGPPASPSADDYFRLACEAWAANDLARIESNLLETIRLDPRHAAAHDVLGRWYEQIDRTVDSLRHSNIAVELDPTNKHFLVSRAFALAADGQAAAAWEMIAPLLDDAQVSERAARLYGQIAPKIGHEEQAATWISRLLTNPAAASPERPKLRFTLAALLDRMGRYDQAFEQARIGHQLSPRRHDPMQHESRVARQIAYCTAARLRSLPHANHKNTRPVFIVGMPRSGTSLVEEILAAHPQVFAGGELDAFARAIVAFHAGSNAYPACLDRLTADQTNAAAAQYLSVVSSLNSSARYVTDKMPLNCMFLDLVELLFPQSHVIHCARDPRDTCLSCYLTDFAVGNAFAGDLSQLGHFYSLYRRIMGHWKQTLSVSMLEVRYEDLVADQAGETRRVLEFLDLPWDERCMRFHENKRPVATASREQVHRPIFTSSIGRWRHYEKHLAPLIAALGSV